MSANNEERIYCIAFYLTIALVIVSGIVMAWFLVCTSIGPMGGEYVSSPEEGSNTTEVSNADNAGFSPVEQIIVTKQAMKNVGMAKSIFL